MPLDSVYFYILVSMHPLWIYPLWICLPGWAKSVLCFVVKMTSSPPVKMCVGLMCLLLLLSWLSYNVVALEDSEMCASSLNDNECRNEPNQATRREIIDEYQKGPTSPDLEKLPSPARKVYNPNKDGENGTDEPLVCFAFLSCCDRTYLLKHTLQGLIRHMEEDEPYKIPYEIAWIDNGSSPENQQEILEMFQIENAVPLPKNKGLAFGMNALIFDMCNAPYIVLMEEDWLYMDDAVAEQTEARKSVVARALSVLMANPTVKAEGDSTLPIKGVFMRDENEVTRPSPVQTTTMADQIIQLNKLNGNDTPNYFDIEYYPFCMQAETNGHTFGAFTNGASIYERRALMKVGRMYGEPGDKFHDGFVEANYAFRAGFEFCSSKIPLDNENCGIDNLGACGAAFKHIGGGRGTRPSRLKHQHVQCNSASFLYYGTKYYDLIPKEDCEIDMLDIETQIEMNSDFQAKNAEMNKEMFIKEEQVRSEMRFLVANPDHFRNQWAHLSDQEYKDFVKSVAKQAESPHQVGGIW